jgi:hypothetical protein
VAVSLPGSGGISVSVDVGGTGIQASLNVSDLLGFEVSLGPDGIFVGTDLDVGVTLSPSQIGSATVQIAESVTGIELGKLLNSDQMVLNNLIGDIQDLAPVHATLAGATGLSFTSSGVSDAPLLTSITAPIDALPTAGPVQIAVVSEFPDVVSSQTGALASGGIITLQAPAGADATPVDPLFAAGTYTEYGMALQSVGEAVASAGPATEPVEPSIVATDLSTATLGKDPSNPPTSLAASELALEEFKTIGASGASL